MKQIAFFGATGGLGSKVVPFLEDREFKIDSISSKKVNIKRLDPYKSKLLVITPEEEALGFKYVFQVKLTKDIKRFVMLVVSNHFLEI